MSAEQKTSQVKQNNGAMVPRIIAAADVLEVLTNEGIARLVDGASVLLSEIRIVYDLDKPPGGRPFAPGYRLLMGLVARHAADTLHAGKVRAESAATSTNQPAATGE